MQGPFTESGRSWIKVNSHFKLKFSTKSRRWIIAELQRPPTFRSLIFASFCLLDYFKRMKSQMSQWLENQSRIHILEDRKSPGIHLSIGPSSSDRTLRCESCHVVSISIDLYWKSFFLDSISMKLHLYRLHIWYLLVCITCLAFEHNLFHIR